MPGLNNAPIAKLGVPLIIFALIMGGWLLSNRYRAMHQMLPETGIGRENCALWFVGSSSIHRWISLTRDMQPWIAHNRGINSATYADILPRFANINVAEGKPRAIILYAGENDIADGVPVRTVIRQLAAFLDLRRNKLGEVPVLVLSMKPSPGRRDNLPKQRLFNSAVQNLLPHAAAAYYVDITNPLLKRGQLGDNYQPDGVHMNAQGYRIWADIVRDRLADMLPRNVVRRCTEPA